MSNQSEDKDKHFSQGSKETYDKLSEMQTFKVRTAYDPSLTDSDELDQNEPGLQLIQFEKLLRASIGEALQKLRTDRAPGTKQALQKLTHLIPEFSKVIQRVQQRDKPSYQKESGKLISWKAEKVVLRSIREQSVEKEQAHEAEAKEIKDSLSELENVVDKLKQNLDIAIKKGQIEHWELKLILQRAEKIGDVVSIFASWMRRGNGHFIEEGVHRGQSIKKVQDAVNDLALQLNVTADPLSTEATLSLIFEAYKEVKDHLGEQDRAKRDIQDQATRELEVANKKMEKLRASVKDLASRMNVIADPSSVETMLSGIFEAYKEVNDRLGEQDQAKRDIQDQTTRELEVANKKVEKLRASVKDLASRMNVIADPSSVETMLSGMFEAYKEVNDRLGEQDQAKRDIQDQTTRELEVVNKKVEKLRASVKDLASRLNVRADPSSVETMLSGIFEAYKEVNDRLGEQDQAKRDIQNQTTRELEVANKKLEKLRASVKDLASRLNVRADPSSVETMLSGIFEAYKEVNDRLGEQDQAKRDIQDQASRELEAANEKVNLYEKAISELAGEYVTNIEPLADPIIKLDAVKESYKTLKGEIQKLELKLKRRESTIQFLERTEKQFGSKIEKLTTDNESLVEEIDAKDKQIDELKKKRKSKSEEYEQEELNRQSSKISELEVQIENLQNERDQLRISSGRFDSEINELKKSHGSKLLMLSDSLGSIENRVRAQKSALKKTRPDINAINRSLKHISDLLPEMRKVIESGSQNEGQIQNKNLFEAEGPILALGESLMHGIREFHDFSKDVRTTPSLHSLIQHAYSELVIGYLHEKTAGTRERASRTDAMLVNLKVISEQVLRNSSQPHKGFEKALDEVAKIERLLAPGIINDLKKADTRLDQHSLFQMLLSRVRDYSGIDIVPYYYAVDEGKRLLYGIG